MTNRQIAFVVACVLGIAAAIALVISPSTYEPGVSPGRSVSPMQDWEVWGK